MPSYPYQIAEAQGAIVPGSGTGPADLVLAGGVRAYTGYRAFQDTFALRIGENSTWRRLANIPEPITHAAVAVVGYQMYLCGGYLGKYPGPSIDRCYRFNVTENKWHSFPKLPIKSSGGGMVYIRPMNALFFSTGTFREAGETLATDFADSYMIDLGDLEKGWVSKAPIPNPRNHIGTVEVRGRYFFLGGQHGRDERTSVQNTLSEYLPLENRWVERSNIPSILSHIQTSVKPYRKGFLVVGGSAWWGSIIDMVFYYHLPTDTWHLVGKYPRKAKTIVCGVKTNVLYCATGQANRGIRWDDAYQIALGNLEVKNTTAMT